jgi:hypothetical protein
MKNPNPSRTYSVRDVRYALVRYSNVIHVTCIDKPGSATHTFATSTEAARMMNNPARIIAG